MNAPRRWDVAVVGSSSLVGEALLELLRASDLPLGRVYALDDLRDLARISDEDPQTAPLEAAGFDFSRVRLAFFCGRSQVSRQLAPLAAQHTLVIDASSAFRESPEVPLVAAEVNPQALEQWSAGTGSTPTGLIALPGSAVVALTTVLAPLHAAARLLRVEVASYHSVSGAGRHAIDELARESAALLSGREPRLRAGATRLAFNVVPQVDALTESGDSLEELRLSAETRRLLAAPELAVNATAVRVPVFHGHALAVHVQFQEDLSPEQAGALLAAAPGIRLAGSEGRLADERRAEGDPTGQALAEHGPTKNRAAKQRPTAGVPAERHAPTGHSVERRLIYPTPVTAVEEGDRVHVGRIRRDRTRPASLNLWIAADNVKKCAAINAISVGCILVNRYC